jgi:hypothetical protein
MDQGIGSLMGKGEEPRCLREENRRLRMKRDIQKIGARLLRQRVKLRFQFATPGEEGLFGENALPVYDFVRRQGRGPDPDHEEKIPMAQGLGRGIGSHRGSRRMAKRRGFGCATDVGSAQRPTATSNHGQPVFENRLARDFAVDARTMSTPVTLPPCGQSRAYDLT